MDTLSALRKENIVHYKDTLNSDADIATIDIQLTENNDSILIVESYSPNIVQQMLNKIDEDKSGYVFFLHEIRLNPIKNVMVPKHREATSQEIDHLLFRKIPLDKLPILRMRDPIRRWHNFKKGSVVAIERPNERQLYFRRVV